MSGEREPVPPLASRPVGALAALYLFLHIVPRPGYGFHRDELLYLAMADHLDLLRMQFPPLIAVAGRIAQLIPGPTLFGTRLLAALAGTAVLLLTVEVTRRMGGGRGPQVVAATAFLLSPLFMRTGALFQPVIMEVLAWAWATLAFVALLRGDDRRWWLVFGAAAGVGGLTKFSAAFFGVAVLVGALASPLRRDLRARWPWLALGVGALVALPSVLGQMTWGWPFFEQARILRESQLDRVTPMAFLWEQLLQSFGAAPLVLVAVAGFVASPRLRPFRPVGIAVAVAAALLMAARGKAYYLAPMYPAIFAGGSVVAGTWLASRTWWRRGAIAWAVVLGLVALPLGIPLLPPPAMAAYAQRLGITAAVTTNTGRILPLPQDYADMLGWREQAAAVAGVYHALPEAERSRTVIVGGNYGRAGALAAYHREMGFPYPASRHGDFYAWGPGLTDPAVVIIVGGTVPELGTIFEEVHEAVRVLTPLGVGEEQDVPIHVCRRPREPFAELWARLGVVWG